MMIREWRGRADPARVEAYAEHFLNHVLPELRRIPGFLGATLSRRRREHDVEYLVLTRWRSIDAIRAFAGADPERAVVEPGAIAALVDFDDRVQHYEIVERIDASDRGGAATKP